MLSLVASIVSLWSVVRVDGEIYDHAVFWISGIGALNAGLLLGTAMEVAWRRLPQLPTGVVAVACTLLCATAVNTNLQSLRAFKSNASRRAPQERTALRLWQVLHDYLKAHPDEKPLFKIDQPTWGVAAGDVLQMQKAGVPFAIERGWLPMFSDAVAPKGDETIEMTFAGSWHHLDLMKTPENETIAEGERVFIVRTR
jgi:hypothetical protein